MIKIVLKKETVLFDRDEKGELIPKEVDIVIDERDYEQSKLKGEKIVIVPLPRGELRKVFSNISRVSALVADAKTEEEKDLIRDDPKNDYDRFIIVKKCLQPSFTDEDYEFMKDGMKTAIVNTILFESGLDTRKQTGKKALEEKEDEFAKN